MARPRRTRRTRWLDAAATRVLALLLVGLLVAPPAWSVSGGEVVEGTAPITTDGAVTVIEASNGAIIEWQDFDIDVGETVRFIQPHELARVLNRVVTPDPTQINGNLTANGQVYILNPYGVFFGDTAVVDVGHLIAAAGNLSNEDFAAGIDRFTELGGRIENHGEILAGSVGLFGASVANFGAISAPDGAIWLLAGDEVLVAKHGSPIVLRIGTPAAAQPDGYAVENAGLLDAAGGSVRMAAGDLLSLAVRNRAEGTIRADRIAIEGGERGRVQVEGALDASNASGVGGAIDVRGDLIVLEDAQLDASGSAGGGRIHVGGGWQGARADGEQASRATWVDSDSLLEADALVNGDGGEIVVWSDGNSYIYGDLSARGAGTGNGGAIETSGKHFLDVRGTPDLSAPGGQGGSWLLDPSNIRIVLDLGGVDPDDPRVLNQEFDNIGSAPPSEGIPGVFPVADDSLVEASSIVGALAQGFSVALSTRNIGTSDNTEQGNITFETALDFTGESGIAAGTVALFSLRAANDIVTAPGVGFDDATMNSNLALSLDFLAGDPNQPASPTADTDSQKIEINGDINVGGVVQLVGAGVTVDGTLAARGRTVVDGDEFAVRLESDRDGIATQAITTNGGTVRMLVLADAADLAPTTPLINVAGAVTTEGGSLAIGAVGADIRLVGGVDTTLVADNRGGAIVIDANLLVEDAAAEPPTTRGGSITLDAPMPLDISTGTGGVLITAEHSIDSAASILTESGVVTTITLDNALDESGVALEVPGRRLDIRGDISNPGASVQLTASSGDAEIEIHSDVTLDATVDGMGALSDDDGSILIGGAAGVTIGDNVILRGNDVRLTGGTSGSGDITFGATGGQIIARSARFEAGDGYTPDMSENMSSTIEFGSLEIGPATGSELTTLEISQDAALSSLPATVNFSAPDPDNPTDVTLFVRDATLKLDADGGALVNGRDRAVIGSVQLLDLSEAPVLTLPDLDVQILEDFTIDNSFSGIVNGIDQLDVQSGLLNDGALTVAAGTALSATSELLLHGGANGTGDLIVEAGASLTAGAITLRAGDGTGGVTGAVEGTEAARVEIDAAALIDTTEFTMRQDGAIGGADGSRIHPIASPQPDLQRQTLRSDDSSVTLELNDRGKLENTFLAIAGGSLDVSAFAATPLIVRSLDLGGIGDLVVDDALLDSFEFHSDVTMGPNPTSELVLRAGIANPGNLSLSPGTAIEGDTIRLIASDGPGGNVSSLIAGSAGVTYTRPNSTDAPDTFIFEQDAAIGETSLPVASNFGAAGATLPLQVGIRSTDSGITLFDPDVIPVDPSGKQVLGGPIVTITTATDLTLDTETEFRANETNLTATSADTTDDLKVALGGSTITVAGHDTGEDGVDAGDFRPFDAGFEAVLGARELSITQEATVRAADLPLATFVGDPVTYQLVSTEGSINVEDASKVDGTSLVLLLDGVPTSGDDGGRTIQLTDPTEYNLEALTITHSRGLTLGATIRAAGNVLIEAGTAGQPDEDLVFEPGSLIEGTAIGLRAGSTSFLPLESTPEQLAIVDASQLTVKLTDADGFFEISQDGAIDQNTLPMSIVDAADMPIATTGIGDLELRSRRSNVDIEIADIEYAKSVDVLAGTSDGEVEARITLTQPTGDLDLDVLPMLEDLELRARDTTLAATGTNAAVLAASDKLTIFGASEVDTGTGLTSPESFTIEQTAPFALAQVAGTDQFDAPVLLGLPYTLRDVGSGQNFLVDNDMANKLSVFDLTLDAGATGTIRITSDTEGVPDPDPMLAIPAAPVFAGLTAIADEITIDTARFDTLGPQEYRGTVLLTKPTTRLGALFDDEFNFLFGDIRFIGNLDASPSAAGPTSLVVNVTGTGQFAGDVGASAALQDLTVNFAGGGGSVEFGSSDDAPTDLTDSQVQLTGALTAQSIDAMDYALDRSETTIVRAPSPSVASIVKRSSGTLDIDAYDVIVGEGEKWTTIGRLEIDAANEVQVGDLTAQEIAITADHLTVMRRAASSVLRSDGGSDSDSGVDWVANDFDLELTNGYSEAGSGIAPVVGTPDGSPIGFVDGTNTDVELPFASAAIFADRSELAPEDLVFDNDPTENVALIVLDSRPRGSPASDFSRVLTEPIAAPGRKAPADSPPIDGNAFEEIGIEVRPLSGPESARRRRAAGVLDDASGGWTSDRSMVRVASQRIDATQAHEAIALHHQVFGRDMEHAEEIRAVLGRAVGDYRDHTGARRVLGFELRRFLRNRPSTQFEAHQLLERLDRLFSAHRRSGLVPGEYRPIQLRWVQQITPIGIATSELAEAIHPSRYVRGSDVLDVFGE